MKLKNTIFTFGGTCGAFSVLVIQEASWLVLERLGLHFHIIDINNDSPLVMTRLNILGSALTSFVNSKVTSIRQSFWSKFTNSGIKFATSISILKTAQQNAWRANYHAKIISNPSESNSTIAQRIIYKKNSIKCGF